MSAPPMIKRAPPCNINLCTIIYSSQRVAVVGDEDIGVGNAPRSLCNAHLLGLCGSADLQSVLVRALGSAIAALAAAGAA